jgi:type II secretory pathway component PulF
MIRKTFHLSLTFLDFKLVYFLQQLLPLLNNFITLYQAIDLLVHKLKRLKHQCFNDFIQYLNFSH